MPVVKRTASCISYKSCQVRTIGWHCVESFDEFGRDKSIRVEVGRDRRIQDEFSRIGIRVVQVGRSAAFVKLPAVKCRSLRHTEKVASEDGTNRAGSEMVPNLRVPDSVACIIWLLPTIIGTEGLSSTRFDKSCRSQTMVVLQPESMMRWL